MDKRKARARKTEKESDFSAHIDFNKSSLIDVQLQASVLVQSTCNNRAAYEIAAKNCRKTPESSDCPRRICQTDN